MISIKSKRYVRLETELEYFITTTAFNVLREIMILVVSETV